MNISAINQNPLPTSFGNYPESRMGRLLLEMGKITPEDAERALQLQRKEGLRFGDAALKLRLVSEADIRRAARADPRVPATCARPPPPDSCARRPG